MAFPLSLKIMCRHWISGMALLLLLCVCERMFFVFYLLAVWLSSSTVDVDGDDYDHTMSHHGPISVDNSTMILYSMRLLMEMEIKWNQMKWKQKQQQSEQLFSNIIINSDFYWGTNDFFVCFWLNVECAYTLIPCNGSECLRALSDELSERLLFKRMCQYLNITSAHLKKPATTTDKVYLHCHYTLETHNKRLSTKFYQQHNGEQC